MDYLTLTEQHDRGFRRNMTYAVLRDIKVGADVLPRLRDAVVRWIGDGCMTISGFELDNTTKECTVQSCTSKLLTMTLTVELAPDYATLHRGSPPSTGP